MHRLGLLAPALLLLTSLFSSPGHAQGLALEDVLADVQQVLQPEDTGPIARGADWVLLDSPVDKEPELGDRGLVVVVHGFGNDYLELSETIHSTWAGLRFAMGATALRGGELFQDRKVVYYQYLPNRPYDELGAEFAAVIAEAFPGAAPVIVAHSAGALLARHAARTLPIKAVVGIAPADHGAQAASFMAATEDLSGLLGEAHAATIAAARERFEVADDVLASLAWDNADGVLRSSDAEEYGIPVGDYPAMSYARYAHYGVVERFRPDVVALINDGFEEGGIERDAREFAAMASYDEAWTGNDGVVAPAEGDGEDSESLRYYPDLRHAEMLFAPRVLAKVVEDIDAALGLEASEPTGEDEGAEDQVATAEDGDEATASDDEAEADTAEVAADEDEASDDEAEEERPVRRRRRGNVVNVGTNNGVIQSGGTNVYIESMEVIGAPGRGHLDEDEDEGDAEDEGDEVAERRARRRLRARRLAERIAERVADTAERVVEDGDSWLGQEDEEEEAEED